MRNGIVISESPALLPRSGTEIQGDTERRRLGGKGSVVRGRARRNTRRKEEAGWREVVVVVGGEAVEGGGVRERESEVREGGGVPLIPRYNAHITFPSP